MTVGLAKAAYVLGLGTVYIESDYEQNRVIAGSQRLIEPSDPYEVFGDLEAGEARRFFNAQATWPDGYRQTMVPSMRAWRNWHALIHSGRRLT